MDLIITILPVVTKDLPISPRFTPYNFLSRCKFSTLTTRQPMVEFYLLTFPRFPLHKKEHKSYFGKNRTHDFRTSRCAGYLLDHSARCEASSSASAAGPSRTPSRVVGSPHGAFLLKKREKERPGVLQKIKAPRGVYSVFCEFLHFLAPRGVCFVGGAYSVLYGISRSDDAARTRSPVDHTFCLRVSPWACTPRVLPWVSRAPRQPRPASAGARGT